MPAYFSISFELKKGPNAIIEFFYALNQTGLKFKSGFWGFENDSFDDIVKWNQSKLDDDFILGFTEHYSHGYKQMLFHYSDFSEVRLFIMNNVRESTFLAHLIVPEDDLVEYVEENGQYVANKMQERMEHLKQLAKTIWTVSSALTIQTAWECSDAPVKYDKISPNCPPQTEPFSIISSKKCFKQWDIKKKYIERDGVFLEQEENWFWC